LAPPSGVTSLEFPRDLWHHKIRRIALSCGIKNITGNFFGLVTKHACDRRTDGRTDRQDRASIAASRGNNAQPKLCARVTSGYILNVIDSKYTHDSCVYLESTRLSLYPLFCGLVRVITFCLSRRRHKMYCGHARLCVCGCLSVRGRTPTLLHGPGCNLGAW